MFFSDECGQQINHGGVGLPRDTEDIFRSHHSLRRDLEKSPAPIPPTSKKDLPDLVIYSYIFKALENIIQRRAPPLLQPLTVSARNGQEQPTEVTFIFRCSELWFRRGMRLSSSYRAPCHLKGPLGRAVTGAGVWPFPGCRRGPPATCFSGWERKSATQREGR